MHGELMLLPFPLLEDVTVLSGRLEILENSVFTYTGGSRQNASYGRTEEDNRIKDIIC